VDVGELGIRWPASCLGTTRRFIAEHPAAVRGVLQAYIAGTHWMRAHKEEALEMLMRFTDSHDRAIMEEAYKTVLKYQQPVPYPTLDGVQTILSTVANENAAAATPDRFIDDRILRELESSGFIKSVAQ
jgi:ABC-type nitrate/sulfonate/bicarbonate transport system substrate-binding protein